MNPTKRKEYFNKLLTRYRVSWKVTEDCPGFGFDSEAQVLYIPEAYSSNRMLMVYALHELAHYVLGHVNSEDPDVVRNDDFAAWSWAFARMDEPLSWPEIQFVLNNLDFPKIKRR